MDVIETLCDGVDWIHLTRDIDGWRNVMRTVMTLAVHKLSPYQPTNDPLHDDVSRGHTNELITTRGRGRFTSLNSVFSLPCDIQGQWNTVHTSSRTLTPINVSLVIGCTTPPLIRMTGTDRQDNSDCS
jgi:hypothetical protein